MKFKILTSMLAIVLIAGCVIPGLPGIPTGPGIGAGRGLEITEFTAEPSPVYSGSKVRVTMGVENQGGTTVPKDEARVYLTGSNVDIEGFNDLYWRGTNESADKPFTRDMKPADAVKGTPADTSRFTWTLTAPNVTAGQTRTDTFYGRTYCDYSTGVNGNVWIYTEGEADAARASGRALNKALFTSTSGPVGLGVKASPDPVIYYGTGETFSLYITVSNLATGTIYVTGKSYSSDIPTIGAEDYNKVYIDINYDTSKLSITNSDACTGSQELPAGKQTTLVCDITITSPPDTFQSYPITITAEYGYYTERSTSVTVQGR